MYTSFLLSFLSVALGVLLTLIGGSGWKINLLLPLRSFAMAALLSSVFLHLLPESIFVGGGWTTLAFLAGLLLPNLMSWLFGKVTTSWSIRATGDRWSHRRIVLIFSLAGVLMHQFGDGLALGNFTSGSHGAHLHWDLIISIAAHTVPVAAVVTLRMKHRRNVIAMGLAMVAATAVGMWAANVGDAGSASFALPWISAAVAGLLLHILAHDTPTTKRTVAARLTEAVAILLGLALPFLLGEHAEHASNADAGVANAPMVASIFLHQLLEISPMILIGLVFSVAVTRRSHLVPTRWFVERDAMKAAVAGSVLGLVVPQCSCGVLPVAKSLFNRGAATATVVAFLILTPEIGIDAVLLTAYGLGWQIALIRVGAAMVISIFAAVLIDRLAPNGARSAAFAGSLHHEPHHATSAQATTLLDSVDEVMIHSGPWIIAGVTTAVILELAMAGRSMQMFESYYTELLAITAVAIPSYVCAAAATPVAVTLVAHGLSPGAALVGLLLGSISNVATLGFLRQTFGLRGIAIALVPAVAVTWSAAMFVNASSFSAELIARSRLHSSHNWAQYVTLIALGLCALHALWRFGLSAWLEPIVGNHHSHHHQHEDDEHCGDGCHQHIGADSHAHADEHRDQHSHNDAKHLSL